MRFVCSDKHFIVLDKAAVSLEVEGEPNLGTFVDLADERLIGIARLLGMEELPPSNDEAMKRLGIVGFEKVEESVNTTDNSPTLQNQTNMPACVICGKPVQSKRHTTCSQKCLKEKTRRYAREYYNRKDKATEDAGNESAPLSQPAAG